MQILHPSDHEQYSEILSSLGEFMEKKILPLSPKFDAEELSIAKSRKELLGQGLCQIPFPSEYGGLGLPFSVYATAIELLGYADASTALSIEIHNAVSEGISQFGSKDQKERYLPKLTSGEMLASFSLTEPTSGSDARTMGTTAKRTGDSFVING